VSIGIKIAIVCKYTINQRIIESNEHHHFIACVINDISNRPELDATPLFVCVIFGQKTNDQAGSISIDILQSRVKAWHRKLGFVEIIVEDRIVPEYTKEPSSDGFSERTDLARERQGDIKEMVSNVV
jgi:hypothetical protein